MQITLTGKPAGDPTVGESVKWISVQRGRCCAPFWPFWLAVLLLAPAMASPAEAGKRPSVYVVNYPLKYFAQRIGGAHVNVELPVPGGEDPAFWQPSVEIIGGYQQADLIVLNGAGYARWTRAATLPRRRLVDTSRSFAQRLLTGDDVSHSHGKTGAHAHGQLAFTTWLDLTQAVSQAQAVMQALADRRGDLRDPFEREFEVLKNELMTLDGALLAMVRNAPDRPLLASHPVYQYLARRYGLNLRSMHWEPDQSPDESEWAKLVVLLADHRAKWMIWEGPPRPEIVGRLEKMGITSLVFTPCANVPEQGDFLTVMRANVANLHRAFE